MSLENSKMLLTNFSKNLTTPFKIISAKISIKYVY